MSSPWLMAPLGHSGSHAPQLMHSSVMMVAIGPSPRAHAGGHGRVIQRVPVRSQGAPGGVPGTLSDYTHGETVRPPGPLLPQGQGPGPASALRVQDRGDRAPPSAPRPG